MDNPTRPVWIRGPQLRERWGSGPGKPMPNSTFYDRIEKGLIPKPKYPFGPGTPPHWDFDEIEARERQLPSTRTMAPPLEAPAPKRKPGRPRKDRSVQAPTTTEVA